MYHKRSSLKIILALFGSAVLGLLAACNAGVDTPSSPGPTQGSPTEGGEQPTANVSRDDDTAVPHASDPTDNQGGSGQETQPSEVTAVPPPPPSISTADIYVNFNAATIPFDTRLLGTNIPAWLNPARLGNETFQARTAAAGIPLYRIPGGSWANAYDWLACERRGQGIDANAVCQWEWAANPTDFINFLQTVGGEAMYTVNFNGTAKEAAALVAFFNGAVDDETVIGVDVRGRDWGTVGDWAQLRADNGNPEPFTVRYWEIGNEIYGGKPDMGTDCTFAWGWEDVWTCDGREYVKGIGSGADRREGFLEFRNEMRKVDSNIMVGAVGVSPQDEWSNWGNEVIEEAGDALDFYVIHQYAYFNPTDPRVTYEEMLAYPQTMWPELMQETSAAFNRYANGRYIPIAITEHNLVSVQNNDSEQLMTRAVNMLFMADSIGQMAVQGFAMANQWDLANGRAYNGTDYGLLDAETYDRSPQYYIFPLWAQFGTQMLPVASTYAAGTTLSVYAGKTESQTVTLIVINKTEDDITAEIEIDGISSIARGTADTVRASSLDAQTVEFNGAANPANDFSDAPSTELTGLGEVPFSYTFVPYSVTLLNVEINE